MMKQMTLEQIILKNLLRNEPYTRKVLPHLKEEYFHNKDEKLLFQEMNAYIQKYNLLPTTEAIQISLQQKDGIFEETFKTANGLLSHIASSTEESNEDWLLDQTEKWCKDSALHNAVKESILILDPTEGKKTNKTKDAIPEIITKALGVSFNPDVGHDYMEDWEKRFEYYHRTEDRIPFDLDYFNKITGGGLAKKTLSVILAPPNVGKSLFMCHFASSILRQHKNVLYITLEMSRERIAARIDANLLDTALDTILTLPKESYERKIRFMKEGVKGKLVVAEYPTASASTTHFRALLNELKLKKQFKPDIIFIDYLNICCSARLRLGQTVSSYTYVKAIVEEMRGLAQEYDLPIVSATQTNRSGATNSDPDMTDTSESFGVPMTADNVWALINNEEMEQIGQIMIKQIRNRDNDVTKNKKFMVGIDRSKMKVINIPEDQQNAYNAPEGKSPEEVYKSVGKNMDKLKKAGIMSG